MSLQEQYPTKKIILVSKDICLRLKAKALNLFSEDYQTGKIKNVEELYTGKTIINAGIITLGANDVMPDTSEVVLANTAGVALNVNGKTDTIGSLSGQKS